MGERGLLERFDGVLVGRPRTNAPPLEWDPDPDEYPAELENVVTRELGRYVPDAVAGFGYDFGHTDPSFPLPLGAVATLDPEEKALRFRTGLIVGPPAQASSRYRYGRSAMTSTSPRSPTAPTRWRCGAGCRSPRISRRVRGSPAPSAACRPRRARRGSSRTGRIQRRSYVLPTVSEHIGFSETGVRQ